MPADDKQRSEYFWHKHKDGSWHKKNKGREPEKPLKYRKLGVKWQ